MALTLIHVDCVSISAALCSSPQGFRVELDRVKHLPCCETKTFEVHFDQPVLGPLTNLCWDF